MVEGNTAYSGGGVSIRYNGTAGTAASLHNCIVVNNTAEYGGGVSFCGATSAASSHFSNFTVASNRATEQGGGVYFVHANQRAYNSIFWNNVNVKSGEEVVENVYVHSNATGTPKFYNNIIDKDYDKLTPISGVIASDSAAIFGENWVTLPTSPGVDKGTTSVGDNLTLPIVDYAGNPRITNDAIDIGPYEYMPIPAGLTGLTGQVAKTGVELAWEASEGAAGYRIYKDDGEQSEATTLVAAVPGLSCVVEGLTAATAYTFSVEAFNGGGATPKVSLKLTTLGADAPDQPVSLVPSSVAETSLTLSWNVQGNDASTKYIIYCDGVAVDSVENSSTLNIAGLQVWREYTFTVRAKKVVGDQAYFSLASAPLKVHTADLTPPVAPANLTLTSASKSALSLEWNASSDNGVLAGYIISVSGADTTFTDTLRLAGISDKILTGLNGKMRYRASGLGASIDYTVGIKAFDEASNLSDAANSIFSTNAADEPFIWYVGSWFGKPADRVKDRVDSAFVAAAGVPNAQVWIQGEHTLTYRIAMADKSINGFSFYGGFAGYENSPDERIKVGEKGWEFAHPTKIKRNGDYAIHSSSTNAPEGDIVIDGLVLEGNNFGNFSGIYWNSSSQTTNVSIRNCVVQNFGIEASTAEGGGIRLGGEARHESFVVENCLIQGNNARNGGGISMDGYRTIRNCEIRNNTASTASNVSPTTPDSIAEPRGAGGGIYVYQALGASSITGCIVEGNTAHSGGGIFLRYVADSAGVHNNIIANNTAGYGGGLSFRAVDASRNPAGIVSNLTIASNRATVRGAGVYFADSGQQVYNTIFWSNLNTSGEAPTVENVYVAAGIPAPVFSHNIIDRVDYENLTATACIAEADSAALFGAGWVTLLPGVAADAGIGIAPPAPATAAPATDMAGLLRVVGGAIDIGPYELQAEAGAPSTPQNFTGVARNLTGVRGEGEIILSWVASTPAEGDEVASYTIYLDGNSVQTVPASRTADTLKNLNDGTYLVQLAAVSASGKVSPKTPNDLILDILADSYSVTINESAGITITAPTGTSGKTHTVPLGSSLEVKFTVNAGYENPVVLLDGEPVTPAVSNGEYSLVVESSVSVTLSISVTPIPVVTIAADNVSINVISPSGSSHPTPAGSQLVIQFAPKVGYENPTVTVGNEVVAPVDNGGTYTVTITVTASVTVTISAAPVTSTGIDGIEPGDYVVATVYYNLQGQEIRKPAISGIYILKKTYASRKVLATKRLVIVNE
ncbi:MAG: fibronectin type III domain-containing protein [Prevotellaceae bacterium]|nr:fibronectin type III domain-containing protein [Prevotellaceae bacterium]